LEEKDKHSVKKISSTFVEGISCTTPLRIDEDGICAKDCERPKWQYID